jgi:hypothetical protein
MRRLYRVTLQKVILHLHAWVWRHPGHRSFLLANYCAMYASASKTRQIEIFKINISILAAEEEWGLSRHATRSGAVFYILSISRSAPSLFGRLSLCLHLEVSRDLEKIYRKKIVKWWIFALCMERKLRFWVDTSFCAFWGVFTVCQTAFNLNFGRITVWWTCNWMSWGSCL